MTAVDLERKWREEADRLEPLTSFDATTSIVRRQCANELAQWRKEKMATVTNNLSLSAYASRWILREILGEDDVRDE